MPRPGPTARRAIVLRRANGRYVKTLDFAASDYQARSKAQKFFAKYDVSTYYIAIERV